MKFRRCERQSEKFYLLYKAKLQKLCNIIDKYFELNIILLLWLYYITPDVPKMPGVQTNFWTYVLKLKTQSPLLETVLLLWLYCNINDDQKLLNSGFVFSKRISQCFGYLFTQAIGRNHLYSVCKLYCPVQYWGFTCLDVNFYHIIMQ